MIWDCVNFNHVSLHSPLAHPLWLLACIAHPMVTIFFVQINYISRVLFVRYYARCNFHLNTGTPLRRGCIRVGASPAELAMAGPFGGLNSTFGPQPPMTPFGPFGAQFGAGPMFPGFNATQGMMGLQGGASPFAGTMQPQPPFLPTAPVAQGGFGSEYHIMPHTLPVLDQVIAAFNSLSVPTTKSSVGLEAK